MIKSDNLLLAYANSFLFALKEFLIIFKNKIILKVLSVLTRRVKKQYVCESINFIYIRGGV